MEQAMAQGEVPTVAGGRGARTGVKEGCEGSWFTFTFIRPLGQDAQPVNHRSRGDT